MNDRITFQSLERSEKITSMELFVVWLVSIAVFGSVGYFSITIAERFFNVLYPIVAGMF